MLTTSDVEQKTFSTALRGYDLDEVDDFLDEIVATFKELHGQLEEARAARDSTTPAESPTPATKPEPEVVSEPVSEPAAAESHPAVDEGAIGRALIAAQTAADSLLEDAQTEAGRIIEDARGEADSWTEERDAKKREAESVIAALVARVSSVRSELAVLAGEVSDRLDDMDNVLDGSVDSDRSDQPDDGEFADSSDDPAFDGDTDEAAESGSNDSIDPSVTTTGAAAAEGSDHLDEILNGVANDLQLESDANDEENPGEVEGDDEDE